jgi:hypothetical protein
MGHEGSLPGAQGPVNGPRLEPGEFSHNPNTQSFITHFDTISPPKPQPQSSLSLSCLAITFLHAFHLPHDEFYKTQNKLQATC